MIAGTFVFQNLEQCLEHCNCSVIFVARIDGKILNTGMFANQSDCIENRRAGEYAPKLREYYYAFIEDS